MANTSDFNVFLSAIEECERSFPVSSWRVNGLPVWPLVRTDGRAEIMPASPLPQKKSGRISRLLGDLASPALAPLKNYSDWKHETLALKPVDALFFGNTSAQDLVDGAWRDRYCGPAIENLKDASINHLLMQAGAQKLPREHDTYSIDWIDSWSRLLSRTRPSHGIHLPGHSEVLQFMRDRRLDLPVLAVAALQRRSALISAAAGLFDRILEKTRPKIGFTAGYYWPMGYAFNLACRRRGILTVDIQHGAQDGRHEAYNLWHNVPAEGYSILPAVFWNWSQTDAKAIDAWANRLQAPWHRALCGGHPQLAPFLEDANRQTQAFDARIADIKKRTAGTFDILIALQDIEGYGPVWDRLADLVRHAPPTWRWWVRRHPVPAYNYGVGIKNLISLNLPNVILEESTTLPLPALLRNVSAVLSLLSSTAVEASYFGHRAVFLTEDARKQFSELFEADHAEVITDMSVLEARLAAMEQELKPLQRTYNPPALKQTLNRLFEMARQTAPRTRTLVSPGGYDPPTL